MAQANSSIPGNNQGDAAIQLRRRPNQPITEVTRGFRAANDAIEERLSSRDDGVARIRRRPTQSLTEVTRGYKATNDALEQKMGLAQTVDDRATSEAVMREELHHAAAEIVLACSSMKGGIADIRKDQIDPHVFAETAELFVTAVRSFAQAIQNQRRGGALQNMREAIERLERTQGLR